MGEREHEIRIEGPGRPLEPFYLAFGYANCDYTYTPPTLRMYDHLSAYAGGPRYMRLHNVLTMHGQGDRYLLAGSHYGNPEDHAPVDRVFRLEDGELRADWTLVDRVYDLMLAHGFRPIVETHRVPSCLREPGTIYDDAPTDFRLWQEAIAKFVRHLAERYGLEEIRRWYFEVWNEPDGRPAWNRDFQPFFALYDHMEHAVHGVDDALRVGGPATMQWEVSYRLFEAFLEHCESGVNYATGTRGTRVDFLSVHCKGGRTDGNCPSSDAMFTALRRYVEILDGHPRFRHTPFFNDESDIVWSGNQGVDRAAWLNFRNTHYFPGFVAKMVDRYCRELIDELEVNLAVVDSDNCHQQWERRLFSGNRAQLTPLSAYGTTDLLRKAAFNVYPLLARLGRERLRTSCPDSGFATKFGALATRDDGAAALLAWHFEDGMDEDAPARRLRLAADGLLPTGRYRLIEFRIDAEHANPYRRWRELGAPAEPDRGQIRALGRNRGPEPIGPIRELEIADRLELDVRLPMHAVSLLLVLPDADPAPRAPAWWSHAVETGAGGPQVFLKWRPNPERNCVGYRLERAADGGEAEIVCDADWFNLAVYVDDEVEAGHRYRYRVCAVDAQGRSSPWSEPLAVAC